MVICYKFIYQKKCTSNKSLFGFIRSLAGYYIFIVKYKHHRILKDQEMDAFLEKNDEFRHTLFQQCVLGMASVIILPSVTVFMICWFHAPGFSVLIFLAAASVWLDMLKKSRIIIMKQLNEGQVFLYKFEQKKKRLLNSQAVSKVQTKKNRIKIGKKAIVQIGIVWFMIACGELVLILMLKDTLEGGIFDSRNIKETIFASPVFITLWLLTGLSYTIYRLMDQEARDAIKRRFTYAKYIKNKSEIRVWASEEIGDLMDEFLYMCGLLNIKEVKIVLSDLENKQVYSNVKNGQMPEINIGKDVFNKAKEFYQQEYKEIIKMITAHELVHIYFKDGMRAIRRYLLSLLVYGVMIALAVVGARCDNMVCLIIAAAYLVFDCTIPRILRDDRYWNQVKEFRADAIGMEISQTSAEVFEKAMNCVVEDEEKDFVGNINKTNLLYWGYKCGVEQQIHPSMERRIYEARRGRKWEKGEYIRYLWLIGRNVFTGKGWKI